MSKHLWEVKHSYYCNNGNFYSNECGAEYRSWADFLASEGDADFDMNLVFRFDWHEDEEEGDGSAKFTGDVNYRNGRIYIYWIGQRKSIYRYTSADVCRADEPAVIEFLKPRLAHLLSLWEPLSWTSA